MRLVSSHQSIDNLDVPEVTESFTFSSAQLKLSIYIIVYRNSLNGNFFKIWNDGFDGLTQRYQTKSGHSAEKGKCLDSNI